MSEPEPKALTLDDHGLTLDTHGFDWRNVEEADGSKSTIVLGKKHHLKGWIMQHGPDHWAARTAAGDRADFETEEDAKAFLKLVLYSTPDN